MKEVHFSDSELIYEVGDRADAIYSVISGFVILRRPNPGGAILEQLIGPGAVFGAAEVLAGTVHAATARAHGDEHIRLPRELRRIEQPLPAQR